LTDRLRSTKRRSTMSNDDSSGKLPILSQKRTDDKRVLASPIDIEQALENLAGDRELLMEVLDTFMETMPKILKDLHNAVSNKDASRLAAAAHSLKGAAANVCAEPIRRSARQLEERGWCNELQDVDRLLADLHKHVDRLGTFAEKVRQE